MKTYKSEANYSLYEYTFNELGNIDSIHATTGEVTNAELKHDVAYLSVQDETFNFGQALARLKRAEFIEIQINELDRKNKLDLSINNLAITALKNQRDTLLEQIAENFGKVSNERIKELVTDLTLSA